MNMKIRNVDAGAILEEAQKLNFEGFRLMQICATRGTLPDPAGAKTSAEGETVTETGAAQAAEPAKTAAPTAGNAAAQEPTIPAYEILYTFGMGLRMENLKVTIPQDTEISSITSVYPCAFLYENEMHDLFGVTIKMINLDYRGYLYRTAEKTPFKE